MPLFLPVVFFLKQLWLADFVGIALFAGVCFEACPSDMPRVKCSPELEVANLNRRATETANKSMKRSLEIALKNKPSVIKPLYDKMLSLGVTESNLTEREDVPLSFAATAMVERQKSKQVGVLKQRIWQVVIL